MGTGCNFPELLARDLEDSEPVFASKRMTAGAPSLALAAVDLDLHYNSRESPGLLAAGPVSRQQQQHRKLKRVRSNRELRDRGEVSELSSPEASPNARAKTDRPTRKSRQILVAHDNSHSSGHPYSRPVSQQKQHQHQQQPAAEADDGGHASSSSQDLPAGIRKHRKNSKDGSGSGGNSTDSSRCFDVDRYRHNSSSSAQGWRPHRSVTTAATSVTSDRRSSTMSHQPLTLEDHGFLPWEADETDSDFSRPVSQSSALGISRPTALGHHHNHNHNYNCHHHIGGESTLHMQPSLSDVGSAVQTGLSVPRRRSSLRGPGPPPYSHPQAQAAASAGLIDGFQFIQSTTARPSAVPKYGCGAVNGEPTAVRSKRLLQTGQANIRGGSFDFVPANEDSAGIADMASGGGDGSADDGAPEPIKKVLKVVGWNTSVTCADAGATMASVSLPHPSQHVGSLAPAESPVTAYAAPPIPLPDNMIETLRVYSGCFPDTMLLCSCLPIDTIRSYSRKLRRLNWHETAEARELLWASSEPPSPTNKGRWRFANVLLPRRSTEPTVLPPAPFGGTAPAGWQSHLHLPKRTQSVATPTNFSIKTTPRSPQDYGQGHHLKHTVSLVDTGGSNSSSYNHHGKRPSTPAASVSAAPAALGAPDFGRFKSIFAGANDYLCNALYAHIVAYNYISLLCATSQPHQAQAATALNAGARPSSQRQRRQEQPFSHHHHHAHRQNQQQPSRTTRRNDNREVAENGGHIPKKAAHLLGLAQGSTATTASFVRVNAAELGIVDVGSSQPRRPSTRREMAAAAAGIGTAGTSVLLPESSESSSSSSSSSSSLAVSPRSPRGRGVDRPSAAAQASTSSAPGGTSLTSLRDELARCVICLVSTLQLTTSSDSSLPQQQQQGGGGGGAGVAQPYLIRALCEIVRCCEDSS